MKDIFNEIEFSLAAVSILLSLVMLASALLISRAIRVGSRIIGTRIAVAVRNHPAGQKISHPTAEELKKVVFGDDLPKSTRVTDALDAATAILDPQAEVAISDCCFAELGIRGLEWTVRNGFHCRNCGMRCFRVLYPQGQAPVPCRVRFDCLKCSPHSVQASAKCVCPRECGSSLCSKLDDPKYDLREDSFPAYAPVAPGRFA
jgi:hypothetical protein